MLLSMCFQYKQYIRQIFYVKSKSVYFRCKNWLKFDVLKKVLNSRIFQIFYEKIIKI